MTTRSQADRWRGETLLVASLVLGCASSSAAPSASAPAPPASSPTDVAQTGCSAEERANVLRATQAAVLAAVPREVASLAGAVQPGGTLEGWRLSHGLVVLQGAGGVAVDNLNAEEPVPPLLLYAPSPASAPEDWLDFDGDDGPYRLVGWGYFAPFQPGSEPPSRRCIGAHEWLVHEAGFHTKDGGMVLTTAAPSEPSPPDAAVHFWHPRVWDLHLWVGADGVAVVEYANPNAVKGGLELPRGAFLRMERGQLVPLGADG